jgi:transcriptional regulator with XRE-family HTH domain
VEARTNKFRNWRVANGYSQREVGGLTGLSDSMISLVESGKRQLAPRTRILVARRLGATVDELFDPADVDLEDSEAN